MKLFVSTRIYVWGSVCGGVRVSPASGPVHLPVCCPGTLRWWPAGKEGGHWDALFIGTLDHPHHIGPLGLLGTTWPLLALRACLRCHLVWEMFSAWAQPTDHCLLVYDFSIQENSTA